MRVNGGLQFCRVQQQGAVFLQLHPNLAEPGVAAGVARHRAGDDVAHLAFQRAHDGVAIQDRAFFGRLVVAGQTLKRRGQFVVTVDKGLHRGFHRRRVTCHGQVGRLANVGFFQHHGHTRHHVGQGVARLADGDAVHRQRRIQGRHGLCQHLSAGGVVAEQTAQRAAAGAASAVGNADAHAVAGPSLLVADGQSVRRCTAVVDNAGGDADVGCVDSVANARQRVVAGVDGDAFARLAAVAEAAGIAGRGGGAEVKGQHAVTDHGLGAALAWGHQFLGLRQLADFYRVTAGDGTGPAGGGQQRAVVWGGGDGLQVAGVGECFERGLKVRQSAAQRAVGGHLGFVAGLLGGQRGHRCLCGRHQLRDDACHVQS